MKLKIMIVTLIALATMLSANQVTFEPATSQKAGISDQAPAAPSATTRPVIPFVDSRSETLMYDTNVFNNSLGITGTGAVGADSTIGFATFFVLGDFGITDPRKVGSVILQFGQINASTFRLYIWDNAGGVPNSGGTPLYETSSASLPAINVWETYDLSALNIALPDTFWVGICYNNLATPSEFYLSLNSSQADIHTYGNLSGGPGDWAPMGNYGWGFVYGVRVVVEETGGGGPYVWDFEDGWQGWTHTSALTFPAAWDVVQTTYAGGPYWTYQPPPNAGDSAFIIDSDAAGSGTWVVDTAMSPVVANTGFALLKWGFYLQYDDLNVLLREFTGSAWGSWGVVASYSGTTGPQWDSVDVSGYTGDSLQVAFQYDDGNSWLYGATFDNVGLYPSLDHDVGASAFLSPGTMVAPGTEDVVGVVANYGSSEETYDVHCLVNDNTFAVVLDTTIQVTTGVGEQDTITFGTLDFVDGRTYDLMMATLLSGDVNPTNDTLEQSTYCTAVFWEVLPTMPVTSSGPFAGYATINDTVYIHVFGGNPTASQSLHHVYNTVSGTWAVGTPLPSPANYGGHCSIDNKIYMIGAYIAPTNTYMTIYDAESDIYTTVALPTPINDPGIAVVDNYIYMIGGSTTLSWTPSTNVMLYDVAGDSFFTGVTQLPGAIMAGVGGYLGNDTLIHAAGLATGSIYVNTTYLGYINPSNPASITWTTGPDKPGTGTYRLNGASYLPPSAPGRLYVAAGAITGGYVANTYIYESGAGWATLPDKPVQHSNWGCTMAPVPDTDGEVIMYAAGGYTGSYLNVFHALHTGIAYSPGIFEQPGEAPTAFGFNLLTSNPVVDRVRFQFDMPYQGTVNFSVYDIAGRRVLDSDFSNISAGTHTMVWDRTDNQGREVANGIYFYRVEAAGNVATGKLILVH